VIYWALESLDMDQPLYSQLATLKEDLAQVQFGSGVLIDLGWYPESSTHGRFMVKVVAHHNWEGPVFEQTAQNCSELLCALRLAVSVAQGSLALIGNEV